VTGAIDLHCHFIPPQALDRIRSDGAAHSVTVGDDGRVTFAGVPTAQAIPDGMSDLDRRLAWMDERGIDVQVVSAWMDFSGYNLQPEAGAWLARMLNESTVEALASRGNRFRAMAAVPLQDPVLAADELRYAVRDLGMVAVEIATSAPGREIDDESMDVFWSAAQELNVMVLVHPYAAARSGSLGNFFLWNIAGNPAEETIAAERLIFGGVLSRHPEVVVCLTHGGGFLPYQIGRADRGFEAVPHATRRSLDAAPSTYLRRFFYDTVVHDPIALRWLVERVGHDRVVLGSDYPFPMGDPDPVATVRAAGLGEPIQKAILTDNAATIVGAILHE
jgi:aminocarboxymuconate-semialdehyde decarboxylase